MALEFLLGSDVYISDLVRTNPEDETIDSLEQWDDHMRGIKNVTKNTFPAFTTSLENAILLTPQQWNDLLSPDYDDTTRWNKTEVNVWLDKLIGMIVISSNIGSVSVPHGFLPCDGRSISENQYPKLFALFPVLPDLRGYFIRGYTPNDTVDPDGSSRAIGSVQLPRVGNHTHAPNTLLNQDNLDGVNNDQGFISDIAGPEDEMRPINYNLQYLIRTDDIPGIPPF